MTTEEKLREYILSRYGTVKDFALKCGLPYGTMMTILKRGILNSTASNIITICESLRISADALASGQIVPVDEDYNAHSVDLLPFVRSVIATDDLTIDGIPVTGDEMNRIMEALEISVEMIRRNRRKQ